MQGEKGILGNKLLLLLFVYFLLRIFFIFLDSRFLWDDLVYIVNAKALVGIRTNYNELSYRPFIPSVFFIPFSFLGDLKLQLAISKVLSLLSFVFFVFLIVKFFKRKGIPEYVPFLVMLLSFPLFFVSNYFLTESFFLLFMALSLFFLEKNPSLALFFSGVVGITKFTLLPFPFLFFAYVVFKKGFKVEYLSFLIPLFFFFLYSFFLFKNPFFILFTAFDVAKECGKASPPNFWFFQSLILFYFLELLGFLGYILFEKKKREDVFFFSWLVFFVVAFLFVPLKSFRYVLWFYIPLLYFSSRFFSKHTIVFSFLLVVGSMLFFIFLQNHLSSNFNCYYEALKEVKELSPNKICVNGMDLFFIFAFPEKTYSLNGYYSYLSPEDVCSKIKEVGCDLLIVYKKLLPERGSCGLRKVYENNCFVFYR